MARGFQLHQYLCVATNWKKTNQGFTWFYHCQVYGTTHATAFHGEVVQKCTKIIKKLANHGLQYGYLTISVILTVSLDNVWGYSGTTTPSATIWIYKIGWSEKKKQIRSVASIHPFQTNTNYLTRIYNRTITYLGKIRPPSPGTIIVLEAKEARDHDLEKSGLPRGIWVAVNKWYIYYNNRFYYNILCNHWNNLIICQCILIFTWKRHLVLGGSWWHDGWLRRSISNIHIHGDIPKRFVHVGAPVMKLLPYFKMKLPKKTQTKKQVFVTTLVPSKSPIKNTSSWPFAKETTVDGWNPKPPPGMVLKPCT